MRQIDVELNKLIVSELNARKDLYAGQEDSGLDELASSIRRQGLLSPLIVRSTGEGSYEVLVGQRRLLACRRIGLDPIPCLLRDDLDDADALTLSLVENVHRADMHPLDKARALKALYDRHQSYDRVAKESAWSVATVRKYIQLLSLPDEIQQRLGTNGGPAGVGTLARLASSFAGDEAVEVYDRISGFTQRIQEEIIKRSGGDITSIDDLIEEAQEGAFDIRRCGRSFRCEVIRDIAHRKLNSNDFAELVKEAAADGSPPSPTQKALLDAARAFWKALAAG